MMNNVFGIDIDRDIDIERSLFLKIEPFSFVFGHGI